MPTNIIIPDMGESVRTGVVAKWHKNDGDMVKRDEVVMDLETDKITAEILAPASGALRRAVKEGDTVNIGASVGTVDESASAGAPAQAPAPSAQATAAKPAAPTAKATPATTANGHHAADDVRATPLARKLADEHGVDLAAVTATGAGGRVREQDVMAAVQARGGDGSGVGAGAPVRSAPIAPAAKVAAAAAQPAPAGGVRREKLSPLRQRLAERLVSAQHNAAMLTTFNEIDMSAVMALRARYKEDFEKKHGVGLGFMSFFVKAAVVALKAQPVVNASIVAGSSGDIEVEYHDYCNVAVAVSTPKGLTVPVLRNAERMSFADIEAAIKDRATRARDGKLTLDDLQGGTFTVTNGGIFGSLMSTPILNPPQTAILGMHAIKNRAVENPDKPGEIVLRPMMYVAMSYDHRLLDGQEAVTFLVTVKNCIERPERMLLGM